MLEPVAAETMTLTFSGDGHSQAFVRRRSTMGRPTSAASPGLVALGFPPSGAPLSPQAQGVVLGPIVTKREVEWGTALAFEQDESEHSHATDEPPPASDAIVEHAPSPEVMIPWT